MIIALILSCTVAIDITWKHYLETKCLDNCTVQSAASYVNDLLLKNAGILPYGTHIDNAMIGEGAKDLR